MGGFRLEFLHHIPGRGAVWRGLTLGCTNCPCIFPGRFNFIFNEQPLGLFNKIALEENITDRNNSFLSIYYQAWLYMTIFVLKLYNTEKLFEMVRNLLV